MQTSISLRFTSRIDITGGDGYRWRLVVERSSFWCYCCWELFRPLESRGFRTVLKPSPTSISALHLNQMPIPKPCKKTLIETRRWCERRSHIGRDRIIKVPIVLHRLTRFCCVGKWNQSLGPAFLSAEWGFPVAPCACPARHGSRYVDNETCASRIWGIRPCCTSPLRGFVTSNDEDKERKERTTT